MPHRVGPVRTAFPALRRGVVVDTVRGKVRLRKWPKPRGKNLAPHTRYMNNWFRDASAKIKRADAHMVESAIKMAAGTGLYPRDILMKAGARPFYTLTLPDGSQLHPKRQGLQAVSFQGCRLQLVDPQNISGGANNVIEWPIPEVDTAGLYSGVNPGRITIPNGVNIVNLCAACWATVFSSTTVYTDILRNGSEVVASARDNSVPRITEQVTTGPLLVEAGDYFEYRVNPDSNRTLGASPQNYFTCEILDASLPEGP